MLQCPTPKHHGPTRDVISLVLFTLYTNRCRAHSSDAFNVKFADDTAIGGLISKYEKSDGCVDQFATVMEFKHRKE